MANAISDHLDALGFSEKESSVYLALVEHGRSTVQQISRNTSIPRTSVYPILDSLLDRDLVTKERSPVSTYFSMNKAESIVEHIDQEKKRLDGLSGHAKELAGLLQPYAQGLSGKVPRMRFYEGKQEIEKMLYELMPKWVASYEAVDCYDLWGYQDHSFVEEYSRWHDSAYKTRHPKQHTRLLSNDAGKDIERSYSLTNREVRTLPPGIDLHSTTLVHGEYVLMINCREKPHYAVVLVDKMFADNLRSIFKMLWQAGE